MKAYTDIEQSKKLAEILPIESADMRYVRVYFEGKNSDWFIQLGRPIKSDDVIPAWSLTALLSIYPMVVGRDLDMYCCWQNSKHLHSRHYGNPIDACVEMIEKLHELKML